MYFGLKVDGLCRLLDESSGRIEVVLDAWARIAVDDAKPAAE